MSRSDHRILDFVSLTNEAKSVAGGGGGGNKSVGSGAPPLAAAAAAGAHAAPAPPSGVGGEALQDRKIPDLNLDF